MSLEKEKLFFHVCNDIRSMDASYINFSLCEEDFEENLFEKFFFNRLKKWHKTTCYCSSWNRCDNCDTFEIIIKSNIQKFKTISESTPCDDSKELNNYDDLYYKILTYRF